MIFLILTISAVKASLTTQAAKVGEKIDKIWPRKPGQNMTFMIFDEIKKF